MRLRHDKSCPCPDCRHLAAQRAGFRIFWAAVVALCLLLAILSLTGCSSTVTPAPVAARQAGYGDDGRQNSGFLGFVEGGALIDAGARARYNALIELYGDTWLPPIEADHGVKPLASAWFISNEALQKFMVMSDWKRMGRTFTR